MRLPQVCDFGMPVEQQEEDIRWTLLMSYVGTPVKLVCYKNVIQQLSQLHHMCFLYGDPMWFW